MPSSSSRKSTSAGVRARYSSRSSPGLSGRLSNSARIGVMPTPLAIRRTLRLVRRAEVTTPYGPSVITHVPTGRLWRVRVPSPSALTVRRSVVPVGRRRQGERMRVQPVVRCEQAPAEELSRLGLQLVQVLTLDDDRDDAGGLRPHLGDTQPVANRLS